MKKSHFPLFLLAAGLLSSCGAPASMSSESTSLSSGSAQTSEASSQITSAESSYSSAEASSIDPDEGLDKGKPNRAGYPYVDKLDELKKHEFQGRWIWEARDVLDTHVAFRRHFSTEKSVESAMLYLSAESKATVFLNGEVVAIDAVLKRGPTPFDSFYQEIDVKSFIKEGDNVLCILVHFWGKGGNASVDSQKGGLIYDLVIDGKTISSDASTKVKRQAYYRNQRILSPSGEYPDRPRSTFLSEKEIYYDAQLEESYYEVDVDDSNWASATLVGIPGCLPFGELYLGDIPAFTYEGYQDAQDIDGVIGKKIEEPLTAHFRLPENMQFLPYFELEAEKGGERISFYTNTYRTQNIVSLMDDYVAKKGENAYQQLYWRSGYELLLDLPAGVTLRKVGYRRTRYGANQEGHFVSENTDFTNLFQKAYNTMSICMRDTFMDCPERERSPYSGDSANQISECLYGMGEEGWRMVKKTWQTLQGWAKEDNTFQLRWPSSTSNECPMQNLAFIQTLPDYYHHTGDAGLAKSVYTILVNYLKVFDLEDDGSVKYRPGSFQWTDWGTNQDEDLMENAWYYWACGSLLDLGVELGETKESSFLRERMDSVKGAFADRFKKEGGFATSADNYDDRGNALAVLSGLVEKEDYPLVKNVLSSTENASPYMERFVLEALGKMGEMDLMQSRMHKRYQPMIDFEASTLWEEWSSRPEDGTVNHGWAGSPLVILEKYIAGILPTAAGFANYSITPSSAIGDFHADAMTPKGKIEVALEGDKLTLNCFEGGTLDLRYLKEAKTVEGAIEKNLDGTYTLLDGVATIEF